MVNGFPGTNFASVKPSKTQAQTNLNLITASGRIYSFTLTEGSVERPDLKIFVELKDGALPTDTKPRFVPASAIEDYRTQVDLARMQATEAKKAAAEELATKTAQLNAEVSKLKAEMPQSMRHNVQRCPTLQCGGGMERWQIYLHPREPIRSASLVRSEGRQRKSG